jgi:predicted GNAT family acetyltransferase
MSCCAVTGQGAGIAAALSLMSGRSLRDIDLTAVRRELDRQGVRHR